MYNMPRGFTTLGLFFPPRVCSWDAWILTKNRKKNEEFLFRIETAMNVDGNRKLESTSGYVIHRKKKTLGSALKKSGTER